MSGNTDDTVVPRDGEFTALQPAVEGAPAQFMPATPAIPATPAEPLQPAQYMPAETVQGTPLQPLESGERIEALPAGVSPADGWEQEAPLAPLEAGERIEALPAGVSPADGVETLPLGADGSPETPRYLDSEPEEPGQRPVYKSTGPDDAEPRAYESTGPQSTPRALESTDPDLKPAMLDREAAAQPSDDGGDPPPSSSSDDPPPSSSGDNPPSSTDDPPSTTTGSGSGSSVFVDTDKLSQVIPGLDGIMRQMYSIANGTSNALDGYSLDRGDSYGEAYVKVANPISSQILDGLSSAGGVFGDTAEGAGLMVHNYDVTEDNAASSASDLARSSED
jgi:hypothetical protein